MGTGKKASAIKLSEEERDVLERLVRRRKVARGEAQRAEIILCAADGLNNCEIARAVGASRQTVRTWRERFASLAPRDATILVTRGGMRAGLPTRQ